MLFSIAVPDNYSNDIQLFTMKYENFCSKYEQQLSDIVQ